MVDRHLTGDECASQLFEKQWTTLPLCFIRFEYSLSLMMIALIAANAFLFMMTAADASVRTRSQGHDCDAAYHRLRARCMRLDVNLCGTCYIYRIKQDRTHCNALHSPPVSHCSLVPGQSVARLSDQGIVAFAALAMKAEQS